MFGTATQKQPPPPPQCSSLTLEGWSMTFQTLFIYTIKAWGSDLGIFNKKISLAACSDGFAQY